MQQLGSEFSYQVAEHVSMCLFVLVNTPHRSNHAPLEYLRAQF